MADYEMPGKLRTPEGVEDVTYCYTIADGVCHITYKPEGGVEQPLPTGTMASWAEKDNLWNGVTRSYTLAQSSIDGVINNSYAAFNNFNNTFRDSRLTDDVAVASTLLNKPGISCFNTFRNTYISGIYNLQPLHYNMYGVFAGTGITDVNFNASRMNGAYNFQYCFDSCSWINNIVFGTAADAVDRNFNLLYTFNNCVNVVNINKTSTTYITNGKRTFSNAGRARSDTNYMRTQGAWGGSWNITESADFMFDNCHVFMNQGAFYFSDPIACTGRSLLRNSNCSIEGGWDSTNVCRIDNCNNLVNFMTDAGKTWQQGTGTRWCYVKLVNVGNLHSAFTNSYTTLCAPRVVIFNVEWLTDVRYMFNKTESFTRSISGWSWNYHPTCLFYTSATSDFRNYKEEAKGCLLTWTTNENTQPAPGPWCTIDAPSAIFRNSIADSWSGTPYPYGGVLTRGDTWGSWGPGGSGTTQDFWGGSRSYNWWKPTVSGNELAGEYIHTYW